jgi:hypothetical protein
MTWTDVRYALQVLSEERIGARMREEAARARAIEDMYAGRMMSAVRPGAKD